MDTISILAERCIRCGRCVKVCPALVFGQEKAGTAARADRKRRLARRFGIEGTIHAGMALGMPAFRFPNRIDKKPLDVVGK